MHESTEKTNQWEESNPQRRNGPVRTLDGHHFRLLSTGPCLHCVTVHCLASSQRSLTSPRKGTTSFPSTKTERAVQGSPHNACIRLVGISNEFKAQPSDLTDHDRPLQLSGRARARSHALVLVPGSPASAHGTRTLACGASRSSKFWLAEKLGFHTNKRNLANLPPPPPAHVKTKKVKIFLQKQFLLGYTFRLSFDRLQPKRRQPFASCPGTLAGDRISLLLSSAPENASDLPLDHETKVCHIHLTWLASTS